VRILVISNLYPPRFAGGYELGCAQMVQSLREAGHELRVLTSGGDAAGEAGLVDRSLELAPVGDLARLSVTGQELRQHFHVRGSAVNPGNVDVLAATLEQFDPDVAYLWNLLGIGALGILMVLRERGIQWLWHIMDSVPRQMCGFAVSGPQLARELSSTFPGRYVACSSRVLGEILAGEVDLGDELYVAPNWITGTPAPPRTEFFRGRGHLRVTSASGVLCEPKGTHILIEAAARLRDEGFTNFTVDLFGGIEDGRFRAMVRQHDVASLVRLMGLQPPAELLSRYASYDVFAFPTWEREPFGFAPLEAASMGCVPLVTDRCGYTEWMIDGVDCLKAPRDAGAFAARLAEILRGDVDLAAIGGRAQAIVWRDFHISSVVPKIEMLLGDAARERCQPRTSTDSLSRLGRFADGVVAALIAER
jgi:glycosyltransferase involved in cell wall biosynthesis